MTIEAQNYYRELEKLIGKVKTEDFPSVDYKLLLQQDPIVLNNIFAFIDE